MVIELLFALLCLWIWVQRNVVPVRVERFSADALRAVDDDDALETLRPRYRPKRFRRVSLTVKVVQQVKARFGVINQPTEADRMAVRRYAYDVMTQKMVDISSTDVARVAPLAAELYWAKTATEIEASQIRASNVLRESNARYNTQWYRNWWLMVLSWLRPAED